VYSCKCSHQYIIIKYSDQSIEYQCSECENKEFFDANYYLTNISWYDSIENIFPYSYLENLHIDIKIDDKIDKFTASIVFPIPSDIDLSCDKVEWYQKELFKIVFHLGFEKEQVLLVNFDLERFIPKDYYYYDEYPAQDELIDKHSLLTVYKKRIFDTILQGKHFEFTNDIRSKAKTIEDLDFFIQNPYLKEFDFIYWQNIYILPHKDEQYIDENLLYIQNNRKEKSLKKAVYEDYKYQLRKYESYNFIYPYSICKYIKDTNIATKFLELDLYSYFKELVNQNALEYFFEYLVKHYSQKQILNLFKTYQKQEIFWFIDTIELFGELSYTMRENFAKVPCKYNTLHNEILRYHRAVMHQKLLETNYSYKESYLKACTTIESYTIKLPKNGIELYNWSTALNNCLAGYNELIKSNYTTVYGFFENDTIKFAVEIKNNKITQAKSKYNANLPKKDISLVYGWFKEYFEKENL